ncbi:ankyrin repeat-containing domain protein [Lipomyces kononenkoae]
MPASTKLDENWTKTTDAGERRRIQNRLAQRNYRNNIKQRLRQLELLNAGNLARDENEEDEVVHQQNNNTMTYPVSQPPAARPDNTCSWLSNQNEISVTGHAEIQMDMTSQIEPSQYIFALNTPHTSKLPSPPQSQHPTPPQSQHPQYNYFANPSPPQEQHTTLNFDRQSFGQPTLPSGMQPQYHNRRTSAGTKPDPATQSSFNVGLVPTSNGTRNISIPQYPATAASGTPLHQAAANGHQHIVRFLVLKGANLTARNEAGQTVLHLAAERGHEGVIENALTQGEGGDTKAFIDWVDDEGFTALHRAAAGGHEECVRVLVEAGAEMESSSKSAMLISHMFNKQE